MQVIAFIKMHSPKRLKITDVNPHLICVLCGGYYIDATTIIECLHSFCKSCIVKYLEKNKYCPICDVQIHKTNPLLNIRTDKTLQNIVYKLVPSLFKNEMQRRVEFYQKHPEALPAIPEQRGEVTDNTPVLFPDELLIVCLEYRHVQSNHQVNKRYLHCPAALTVSHLIKLIRGKFGLHSGHQVNIFYKDDPLMEHITLMDIAYTYQCRRKSPIHLTYRILELKRKTIKIIAKEPQKEGNKEEKLLAESEWKEVQLQISENGVMSVRNVESSECSPIPGLEAPPIRSPSLFPPSKDINHLCLTSVSNTIASQGLTSITPPDIVSAVSSPSAVAPVSAVISSSNGAPSLINSVLPGNSESGACPVPITSSAANTISVTASSSPAVVISSSLSLVTTNANEVKPPCIMFPAPVTTSEVNVISPLSITQPITSTPPLSIAMATKTVPGTVPLPSHSLEPCTVSVTTTMAAMKPTTNIVQTSYPIMSTPRPTTEPIVSVSKVSKDQVRKANSIIEVNKLSISRVPPGGMKEKGDVLNKIVNKLSPNERVIGNTSVTIRPVTNTSNPTKLYSGPKLNSGLPNAGVAVTKEKPQPTAKYKTLKSPTKQWNPSIDRSTVLMKQNSDQSKPARFFKMRNMPRFLGNPASGVKPLYACPEEPISSQQKQKLTLMKVDPKTIPTSSIPRSPTKQPPPYTPGSPKLSKQPPTFSDPKPYLSPRMPPSPAHSGSFMPPNPYHLLYSGYPGFSPDPNRMLSPELIRSMCAYHPSLNPSIGMLFNPMHTLARPQDNFKPEQTPTVQRIPPSKTETPPPPKISDEKKPLPLPSPSDNNKCTPPPASPKDDNKTHLLVSESSKVVPQTTETPSQVLKSVEVKENHTNSAKTGEKTNAVDNSLVKMNCDEININNNISKESHPSQNSEGVNRTE